MTLLTTFEDMYETHEQCAQLLAVEGVLLLRNVYFNPPAGYIIKQHTYKLQKKPKGRWKWDILIEIWKLAQVRKET